MTPVRVLHCPICGQVVAPDNPHVPFCGRRCREVDLGRWLGERYSVPVQRTDEEDDEGRSTAEANDAL